MIPILSHYGCLPYMDLKTFSEAESTVFMVAIPVVLFIKSKVKVLTLLKVKINLIAE